MIIKEIKLFNYRNYDNLLIKPSKRLNLIIGNNAQGKTNLLESIIVMSTSRSHRTNCNESIIKDNENLASIEIILDDKKLNMNITNKGRNIFKNEMSYKKVSEFIGELNAVMFSPDDMQVFISSPKIRRRFIDIEISKLDKTYTLNLGMYNSILKERNNYLKSNSIDEKLLEIYDDKLCKIQEYIMYQRKCYVEEINKKISKHFNKVSSNEVKLEVRYNTFLSNNISRENIKNKYIDFKEKDILFKQSNFGIHRDDYEFYFDEKIVNEVCSQGQKRLYLISIKLSIIEIIKDRCNDYPVILLDDVFSEFDNNYSSMLLEVLKDNAQVFITTNNYQEFFSNFKYESKIFEVKKGKIEEVQNGYKD